VDKRCIEGRKPITTDVGVCPTREAGMKRKPAGPAHWKAG